MKTILLSAVFSALLLSTYALAPQADLSGASKVDASKVVDTALVLRRATTKAH